MLPLPGAFNGIVAGKQWQLQYGRISPSYILDSVWHILCFRFNLRHGQDMMLTLKLTGADRNIYNRVSTTTNYYYGDRSQTSKSTNTYLDV
jgi:hypothetical protein